MAIFKAIQKEKMKMVHDEDLENFLDGLGLLRKFQAHQLQCKFCGQTITFENLHSIFPQSGSIKFVCNAPSCIHDLSNLLREGTVTI